MLTFTFYLDLALFQKITLLYQKRERFFPISLFREKISFATEWYVKSIFHVSEHAHI